MNMRFSRKHVVATVATVFLFVAAAALAANFLLTKTAETNNTITFTYPQQAGADGYRYYAPGQINGEQCSGTRLSRTLDPTRTSIRFSKVSSGTYCVEAIVLTPIGAAQYPVAPQGDTEPPTVAMTAPPDGSTVSSLISVSAIASDNVGVTRVEFFRDGVSLGSDAAAPYTVNFDTTTISNGAHTFGARAYDAANNSAPAPQITVTVSNNIPPPSNATLFVSLNGNDTNACSQTAPCRSFNRAYQVAALGAVIEVAAGAYPAQTITDAPGKDSTGDLPDVVIRPAAGATVTVVDLTLGGNVEGSDGPDHLTIKNVSDNSFNSGDCDWAVFGGDIYDITFDGVKTCNFTINTEKGGGQGPSSGLTIKNSELMGCRTGSGYSCGNNKIDGSDQFVFENNYVHDYQVTSSGDHFECMFISDTNSATIQRNKFSHCDYYDIFMQPCNSANGGRCVLQNITIQNNWFDETDNFENTHRDTAIEGTAANLLIRFNTFWNSGYSTSGPQNNVRLVGNIMAGTTCGLSGLTYAYNVFTHGAPTCGTNATSAAASSLFVNATRLNAGGDWHLRPVPNVAVDYVTATSADYLLGNDIDGDTRTAPRDAGADER